MLFEQLHALLSLFRSQLHERLRDGPGGVAGMDARVLRFYARHPGASQSDLVQHSQRDKGQIARLVKSLIERGLLQRDAQAGRRGGLALTAAGQALHDQLHRHHIELTTALGAALSARERTQLAALLQRLQRSLPSQAAAPAAHEAP